MFVRRAFRSVILLLVQRGLKEKESAVKQFDHSVH